MRSTNRKRALIVSGSMILLCLALLTGMTFALFTDEKTVRNHLQAGDLDLTMYRTKLEKTALNEDGFLDVMAADTSKVNFSHPTPEDLAKNRNIFDIESSDKIVPGVSYTATMLLENRSDVACGYWIEIDVAGMDVDDVLASQIQVTVEFEDATKNKTVILSDGFTIGGEATDQQLGVLARYHDDDQQIPYAASFKVTVTFLDSFVTSGMEKYFNDEAQGESLDLDLIVHAVQVTEAP